MVIAKPSLMIRQSLAGLNAKESYSERIFCRGRNSF